MEPFRRRGCVGLKEIGTKHDVFPDVVLCIALGLPGIILFAAIPQLKLWVRCVVLIESIVVAATSTIADGMLYEEYLPVDRKTSVGHIIIWGCLLAFFAKCVDTVWIMLLVLLAVSSLAIFHARMHFTFVVQDWKTARNCARAWHIAGSAVPMALVLLAREKISSCPSLLLK
jgi:hypothetical protein